ncbi:hypothetical protein [Phyllobacterium calauticae]|uniref:hypothetical protein n=1 Tax=Phyllobacterium calauticae TaxID=2817027 RepID=UPI001CBE8D48|nr:hypothetical protein [Phyllobacterium calauticae]MBZ3696037.1 hypothetical protein [Phyllobacterium calauticae]
MPNVPATRVSTSERIPDDVKDRVKALIHQKLNEGRGVAVIPIRDLVAFEHDLDHLNGDQYEAQHVLSAVAFMCGMANAQFVELPLWPDHSVVLVRDEYGSPRKVGDLLRALQVARVAVTQDQRDEADEKLADTLRAITPRVVAARRT